MAVVKIAKTGEHITHLCDCLRCRGTRTPLESWRDMKRADYNSFMEWMESGLVDRWSLGSKRYQSDVKGFQGDPLDHAIEEALDLVLYLWVAKRKRDNN